jgi:hypothetical protein
MAFYRYNAAAFRPDGDEQSHGFDQLADAILWLRERLNAGDGYTVYGEVRSGDQLLWRGGKRPAPDPAQS